ncbi:hypothetical protein [Jeotgalibacillus alimentarius]|uniref:hypothetical protein n=1 Tax=Jeotgalibacillus alimentarius TaxID=135826 RepID=UPI000596F0F1|nr:hypothetical protein [Jeotgalibacillus alimentarius]
MCSHCNGHGATYKFHSFGVETIPCPNEVCQQRNVREYEASRKRVTAKLREAEKRFGVKVGEM